MLRAVHVPVVARGDHEVVVKFEKPIPEFTFLYALGTQHIIPAHLYERGDLATNPANNAPIGTGPYVFKRWVRGSRAEFVRNDAYWEKQRPYPDGLVVRWWREPASRAAALEAGALDIGVQNPVPLADIARLRDSGKFTVTYKGYEISDWESGLIFNVKNPITQHRAVRQAILFSLDRQHIADVIYQDFATPAKSVIGSNNRLYYSEDVPQYPFNKTRAEKLLDEAGFTRKGDAPRFSLRLVAAGWVDENGQEIDVRDPLAAELKAASDNARHASGKVDAILSLPELFPKPLVENVVFRDAVVEAYEILLDGGAMVAVRQLVRT